MFIFSLQFVPLRNPSTPRSHCLYNIRTNIQKKKKLHLMYSALRPSGSRARFPVRRLVRTSCPLVLLLHVIPQESWCSESLSAAVQWWGNTLVWTLATCSL
ncbi:hypothetical protein CEXT_672551 [Caerostris extrusa]|uniref:Uncharacterized protein n=1 Tax=Caerostris extrusa TaxID=172846 RepID=A0AAV4N7E8_CAEEX|nr:hypothetical protein CEXT_672551 [Caerostris extrusa]